MKEHPILFSEMIRAILDGRKTQTRRVVKPQPFPLVKSWLANPNDGSEIKCHYGATGDRLWVRETWSPSPDGPIYRATQHEHGITECGDSCRWKPSIHMPRWASRITLEIVIVRVERLQEISPEDALAEGIWYEKTGGISREEAVEEYRKLWDSLNGKKHPWSSNPWVWVLEFKRIEPPANQRQGE